MKTIQNCFIQTCSVSFHKTLIDGLEWCRLLVDYCDVFISCFNSHSDGTHSLQRIHWWARVVILKFSKSVSMRKQIHIYLVSCMTWGWVNLQQIFIFAWTIPLACLKHTVSPSLIYLTIFHSLCCILRSDCTLLCFILRTFTSSPSHIHPT